MIRFTRFRMIAHNFANHIDQHDLRYVRAEVLAGDRADLVGKEVLLEVTDVCFEERDKPKSP